VPSYPKRLRIRGPICQARNVSQAQWQAGVNRERRHGMCRPGGCDSLFLTRVDARSWLAPDSAASLAQAARLSDGDAVALLPSAALANKLALGAPLGELRNVAGDAVFAFAVSGRAGDAPAGRGGRRWWHRRLFRRREDRPRREAGAAPAAWDHPLV
jgi:hypothetical protein